VRTYVNVDGGMSDNPRPILYQSVYTACLANRALAKSDQMVTIAGKHCESGDVVRKDIALPYTQSGDLLAVFATGAYCSSMGSNYNRVPRPATVMVKDGKAKLIQRRETPIEVLRFDLMAD
jgi:diaminopimelate decarboxylase